jgi:hypothetical protein
MALAGVLWDRQLSPVRVERWALTCAIASFAKC